MKNRSLVMSATLLFLLSLVVAVAKTGSNLLTPRFFQLDSTLFYIIVFSFALGAFVMFLLISFFPPRESQLIRPILPVSSPPLRTLPVIREAETAIQMGEFEKGKELLESISTEDPDYWYAQKMTGDLALEKGDWVKAEHCYQQGLKFTQEQEQSLMLFSLAHLYDHHGMFDQAQDLYKQVLRVAPLAMEPARRLRYHAVKEQDWEQALSWQEYLEQQFPEALSSEEEATMQVGIRFELARNEFELANYRTANSLLKHVLRLTDSFTPGYLLAGEIQEKTENVSAALRMWERGFLNTRHPVLLMRAGEYFLSQNMPEKAIEFQRRTIQGRPEDSILQFCLGDLYMKMEMIEEAVKVFQKIEKENPEWILNRKMLADLYQRTKKHEQAAVIYREIMDSTDRPAVLQWQCYKCNTTYHEYKSFCLECLGWNSVNLNQNKAGEMDIEYEEFPASPDYEGTQS